MSVDSRYCLVVVAAIFGGGVVVDSILYRVRGSLKFVMLEARGPILEARGFYLEDF